jgi:hypothetical protein
MFEINSDWLESERTRLEYVMTELISCHVDQDTLREYGAYPTINAGYKLAGKVAPEIYQNFEKRFVAACGIFGEVGLEISAFGICNAYLDKPSKEPGNQLTQLLTMVQAFGVISGFLVAQRKKSAAAKPGAKARSEKYESQREKVRFLLYDMEGLDSMSADAAAEHMIGKVERKRSINRAIPSSDELA